MAQQAERLEIETQPRLKRMQILVSNKQKAKVTALSRANKASSSEIIRQAIDAYDPEKAGIFDDLAEDELFNIAMSSVDKALKNVSAIRNGISATLAEMDKIEGKK